MQRIAEANDALMISGWACCKLSTGIMCGSSTPHRSRITGGKGSSRVTIVFEPGRRRHHGQGALASVSAAIIALGNGVVVGTVTKHWSFVWTLLALFPLLTDFISFYDSLKLTPDQLSPTPSGPLLHSNLVEHGVRTSDGPLTVWIYVDTGKNVGDIDHLKVFATSEAADKWLDEHDPEGVAFYHEVME